MMETGLPARPTTVVVGAGRRMRNNFLPAFSLLSERLGEVGVWSRDPRHAAEAAAPWGLEVINDLDAALATADVVVVSVTTSAVPQILARLAHHAPRLSLVLDTPVFGSIKHLGSLPRLRRFRRVVVAEDYAQFPQWQLARTVVRSGAIGAVRHVELRHSGFRYHGLALARSLYDYPFARGARAGRDGITFRFGRGRGARIVEPYDQRRGSTLIWGSAGVITHGGPVEESDLAQLDLRFDEAGDPPRFRLGDHYLELPAVPALLAAPTPDPSVFNALKTCGLLRVLEGLWARTEPAYDYRQALYDHLTTAWLRHAPGVVDPLAPFCRNYVTVIEGLLSARPRPALSS